MECYVSPGCKCGIGLPHHLSQMSAFPKSTTPTALKNSDDKDNWEPDRAESKYVEQSVNCNKHVVIKSHPSHSFPMNESRRPTHEKTAFKARSAVDVHERDTPSFRMNQQNAENEEEIIRDLKYKMSHVSFLLAESRNQQHSLRKEFNLLKSILSAELGDGMLVHELLVPGTAEQWKGRAQQISNLETKIIVLKTELETGVRGDYDPRYKAHPDQFIPRKQRELLDKIYEDRKQISEKTDYEIDEFLNDYQTMSLMYNSSTGRNKILAEDLKYLKEHIENLKKKEREDSELIASLVCHQKQMKDIIDKEKVLCDQIYRQHQQELMNMQRGRTGEKPKGVQSQETVDEESGGPDTIKDECDKYREMWESTQGEKKDLEDLVSTLNRKLDEVTNQVIEAERHCREQHCEIKELSEQIAQIKSGGKVLPRRGESPDKSSRFSLLEEKMKVMRDENQYLRSYLQKAIMAKEDDFRIYQASMDNVKRHYLRSLQGLKYSC